jgi:hypothetical protein
VLAGGAAGAACLAIGASCVSAAPKYQLDVGLVALYTGNADGARLQHRCLRVVTPPGTATVGPLTCRHTFCEERLGGWWSAAA